MVKIRLDRSGVRNKPFYRLVVIDSKSKIGGKPLEVLGFWHPREGTKKFDKTRLAFWVERGAKVTRSVGKLLNNE